MASLPLLNSIVPPLGNTGPMAPKDTSPMSPKIPVPTPNPKPITPVPTPGGTPDFNRPGDAQRDKRKQVESGTQAYQRYRAWKLGRSKANAVQSQALSPAPVTPPTPPIQTGVQTTPTVPLPPAVHFPQG